jgi:uncharacterized protein YcgI (DUF1989 family)
MGRAPMEVTLRLSPRQWRLLSDARDRRAPARSLESFVARAIAEEPTTEPPVAVAPPAQIGPETPRAGSVAPGAAAVLELQRGDIVRVEQLSGGQCVDLVAWSRSDARERLSAARTRVIAGASPGLGDALWSGPPYERPLLALIADSAPGHDLLFPACSAREYAAVGCLPEPSCVGVQAAAAAAFGLEPADLPDPLNLWLRAELAADGSLGWRSTATSPGDHVELLALAPLLVIVNPCVDDVFGCSGLEPRPVAVTWRQGDSAEAAAWLAGTPPLPASEISGVARPLERVGQPRPAAPSSWRELVVAVPESPVPPSAAAARAAAVRFSLAVLADSAGSTR